MGSVTFSGFNNIDFNLVLNTLMQQASEPLTALQARQKTLQAQATTYGTLTGRVSAMESAAADLSDLSDISSVSAVSSVPSAVAVSTGAGATAGHYDVVVTELARAQVTASASSAPDATVTAVASGGTITINGVAVAVSGDTTLQGLADAINATDDIGVRAAVIRTGTSAYRLTLTSESTGAANAFAVVNGLTGGTGLTFTDTDGNGVSGDSAADNAVSASDASLLVNNIAVTGSSNTFDDVIPGVTLTALAKDPAATVQVDVTADSSALGARVDRFVSAYNDLMQFVDDQRAAAAKGDGSSIAREPLLRQLGLSLRTTLLGPHGTDTLTRLSEVGIALSSTGRLAVDATALADALRTNESNVRGLLGGADGVFADIHGLLDSYSQAAGLISTVRDRLTQQARSLDDQIASMQARLALQRESLQRQFTEADMAISRLKDQSSSLSSIGANFGSF
jgi:flagellar hook-associated protein 2